MAILVVLFPVALGAWWRAARTATSTAAPPLATRVAIFSQALGSRDSALVTLREAITTGVTNQLSVNAFGVASVAEAQAVERGRLSLDSLVALKQLGTLVELAFESRGERLRVTVPVLDAVTRESVTSSVFERPFAEALQLEPDLVRFVADALRQRLRQAVTLRDSTDASHDATERKLLISATRLRVDADDVLRSGFAYDAEAARDMLLTADSFLQRAQRIEPVWGDVLVERARLWSARTQRRRRWREEGAVRQRAGLRRCRARA